MARLDYWAAMASSCFQLKRNEALSTYTQTINASFQLLFAH
jgi:hypothetical protein